MVWPTDYHQVNSKFGQIDHGLRDDKPHTGVDFKNPLGGNVYSTDSGKVTDTRNIAPGNSGFNKKGGNYIIIHNQGGSVSGYAHTGPAVSKGDIITAGQVIGHSDASGGVRPHLHYSFRERPGAPKSNGLPHVLGTQIRTQMPFSGGYSSGKPGLNWSASGPHPTEF